MSSVRTPAPSPPSTSPEARGEAISESRFALGREIAGGLPGIAAWVITTGLIVYLGVRRGGYEQPVYSEIGIAAWWFVGVGCLAGALSMRIGRAAAVGLGLLAAFAAWTAVGVIWSESSGRSLIEVARVLTYLGVFAMALLLAGRDRIRLILGAVATGIGVIAILALLSRLHPSWFPEDNISEVLVGAQSRLRYPVGYWNALAGLIAVGAPLLLWAATSARSVVLRGLAAAAIPAAMLAGYLTYSRAGIAALAVALLAFIALSERRLALIPALSVIAGISGLLIWQGSTRGDLADGLLTETAAAQGDSLLLLTLAATALCGLLVALFALADRRRLTPEIPAVPRRPALIVLAVAVILAIGAFVGLGGPDEAADAYEDFKDPTGLSETSNRLSSFGGNGRWQYWEQALDANTEEPLTGIGPGTFVFYWSENRSIDNGLVRDAHSLFIETLGELGIVGFLLLTGFVLWVIAIGGGRALEALGERRAEMAAATAAVLAFAVAAALDWLWELAVVPAAFLLVAAAILRAEHDGPDPRVAAVQPPPSPAWRSPLAGGIAVMIVALVAIAAIFIPYTADRHLIESEAALASGDLDGALEEAESAVDLQPYSGEALIQQARVLEQRGELPKAASAAREATVAESTNWETWYRLARIQQQRGKQGSALIALRRAQELNPISQVLNPIRCGQDGQLCEADPVVP